MDVEGRVVRLHIAPDLTCTTRVRRVDDHRQVHELRLYNHQQTIDTMKERGMDMQKLQGSGVYDRQEWERLVTQLATAYKSDATVRVKVLERTVQQVELLHLSPSASVVADALESRVDVCHSPHHHKALNSELAAYGNILPLPLTSGRKSQL